jgi:hypothetical protein
MKLLSAEVSGSTPKGSEHFAQAHLLFGFEHESYLMPDDPKLAALSQEELVALDALTRKLALPSPDACENQIESKPAIELLEVGPGSSEVSD